MNIFKPFIFNINLLTDEIFISSLNDLLIYPQNIQIYESLIHNENFIEPLIRFSPIFNLYNMLSDHTKDTMKPLYNKL